MYLNTSEAEFSDQRASQYQDALAKYPGAWQHDIEEMLRVVKPKTGQTIVDLGGGTGFFSGKIASGVGPNGEVIIVDPSLPQTASVPRGEFGNISVLIQDAAEIDLGINRKADVIWSRGAFHHIVNKEQAFKHFVNIASSNCRLIIVDVFQGQGTAQFFDDFVARTCVTGHEVSYLSPEFAATLCAQSGWQPPKITTQTMLWRFKSREEIGEFLMTLFAAREGTELEDCLASVYRHLEVSAFGDDVFLHWPMTVMATSLISEDIGHGRQ